MYAIRCTKKLLGRSSIPVDDDPGPVQPTTTALGDWFAMPFNVGRHRLVLCTSEHSLLSVVVARRNLAGLPDRLAHAVLTLLHDLDIDARDAFWEMREMTVVRFARTNSRTVLGSMNEFSFMARLYIEDDDVNGDLAKLALRLAETPCSPLKYERPRDVARRLLSSARAQAEEGYPTSQSLRLLH